MCTDCTPNWEPARPGEGETFDPIADAIDAKRHARDREIRAAAGIPEPTIAELGRILGIVAVGKSYQCIVIDCEHVAVEGHMCVAHGKRVWA